jgi:hypothetical protein
MVKLINTRFYYSSIGALLIIFGYIINKSRKKINESKSNIYKIISKIIYIIGWIIFTLSIGISDHKTYDINLKSLLSILGTGILLFSLYKINKIKNDDKNDDKNDINKIILLILHFIGWFILSFSIYYKSQNIGKYILFGLIFIFSSLLYFLPKQRNKCIIDGPGSYLLGLGWLCLILANSIII